MEKKTTCALFFLLVLFGGFGCASASSLPRFVGRLFSSLLSTLLKRIWSLAPSVIKPGIRSSNNVKLEKGYNVQTVFDGSKLGIEPYAVEVSPNGDFLLLDSAGSCIYRISPPLSRYSRPKLVAGSADGYSGHVDGKPREARMNHPKGLTVDEKGNIYVADTMNKAIRKITETGVTTIAGGKWNRRSHVDGANQDAMFSDDFEVVYIGSSCSLLVVDRGNQAIREIQLNFEDCAYEHGAGVTLGIVVLFAAGFLGYMIGMLQRQSRAISSYSSVPNYGTIYSASQYKKCAAAASARTPLIPIEETAEKQGEEEVDISRPFGKYIAGLASSVSSIFGGIFPRRQQNSYSLLPQDSIAVPKEEPPPIEAQTPNPRKTYPFMFEDPRKLQQLWNGPAYFYRANGEEQQQKQTHRYHSRKHRKSSTSTDTYYQESIKSTGEVIFGAVQETDSRHELEKKAANDKRQYDQHGLHYRINKMHHLDEF